MTVYFMRSMRGMIQMLLFMVVVLLIVAYMLPDFSRAAIAYGILYLLISPVSILAFWRYLDKIKIKKDAIISYSFFGKKCCTVDRNKKIYYASVDLRSMAGISHYIAISNTMFSYSLATENTGLSFFKTYDRSKIIMLPYNKKTISVLDLSEYTNLVLK